MNSITRVSGLLCLICILSACSVSPPTERESMMEFANKGVSWGEDSELFTLQLLAKYQAGLASCDDMSKSAQSGLARLSFHIDDMFSQSYEGYRNSERYRLHQNFLYDATQIYAARLSENDCRKMKIELVDYYSWLRR